MEAGQAVWVKFSKYPWWPAVLLTPPTAEDRHATVKFFGSKEMYVPMTVVVRGVYG